ncbi:MAG: hypothetical protein CL678_16180 [Bdellovibrionaceae bacterium]|nr:hypothetical protein [Pseudobdellovibrionaceae bacterium]|tara:strand:+ start:4606 stop:5421 length:816 start_codon:yes stop_codon:yes gene_type:complete
MNYVCLYSDQDDLIVSEIFKDPKLSKQFEMVSLFDFLQYIEIDDEIDNDHIKIRWTLKNNKKISNENTFLVNRLTSLSQVNKFDLNDQNQLSREIQSYFLFSLSQFKKSLSPSKYFSLTGNQFSLLEQWKIADKIKIKTPPYSIGHQDLSEPNKPNTIKTNIYNYFNWSVNNQNQKTNFIIEKPKGRPYFSYSFLNETYTTEPKDKIQQRVLNYTKKIASKLKVDILEYLFFVDKENITFASANPYLLSKNHNVKNFIKSELKKLLKECSL